MSFLSRNAACTETPEPRARRESGVTFRSSRFDEVRTLAAGATEIVVAREAGPFGYERMVVLKRAVSMAPAVRASLIREALSYARLSHPAIVRLHEVVEREGSVELVLEHVDGVSLATLLADLRERHEVLGVDAALFLGSRVFAALAAAHAARHPVTGEYAPVIHRDVAPANVLLPWDGFAKLGDFGIARVSGIPSDTVVGELKGTFGYMAPEQVRGEPVSVRTDVYAACLLLQELLTGRPAFALTLPEEHLLRAMSAAAIASLSDQCPHLPRALVAAIQLGLDPNPEYRRLSAAGMLEALRADAHLEAGRHEVVEHLARLRSKDAMHGLGTTMPPEGPRPMLASVHTPGPIVSPLLESRDAPPREPGAGPALAAALALCVAFALTFAWQSRHDSPSRPVAALRPRAPIAFRVPVARPAPPPVASAAPVAPALPPKAGTLVVEAHPFQRVWLDERLLGEGARRVVVPCGRHVVQIGSRGTPTEIVVACGAEVTARAR